MAFETGSGLSLIETIWDGPDTQLVIGNMSRLPFINWSDMYMNGLGDKVRIYKRALGPEEIKDLASADFSPGPTRAAD